jgi:Xaa-Pro aminopeptidase
MTFTQPTLPAMDFPSRLERLRAGLDAAECDALLVTRLVNVRYLTGFTGSAALLLVRPDRALFVSDGRYQEQSAQQLAAAGVDVDIEISNLNQKDLIIAAAEGVARLGLEADHVTWAQQRRYAEEWFEDTELVPTSGVVDQLRLTKDEGEVARIQAACATADAALASVVRRLVEGPTEEEFGLELDTEIRRLGAEGNSFETIVASGPNAAKPHHSPGTRRIQEGDLVVLDFGALVDGYCSDMTRTFAIGEISETQQRMLDVVGESQRAGVEAVAAGREAKDVDLASREVIDEAGWGDAFLHSTGHGVGLEIHENPRVAQTSEDTLASDYIVTVEPGVYLPEHGGVRIEDTVVVTDDGCRVLTRAPKTTDPLAA